MNSHAGPGGATKTVTSGRRRLRRLLGAVLVLSALAGWQAKTRTADNAREIVQEAQRRTDAKSQRYEGLLQVFDAKGKISDKRWTYDRIGAHGESKSVLRFTAPAEVKGVALLVANHPRSRL